MGDKDFPASSEEVENQQDIIRQLKKPVKRKISSSEFLDNLTEFLCQRDPNQTTEELIAELEEDGIDTNAILKRTATLLKKYGINQTWMDKY